jgi:hypothetical protein
LRRISIGRGQFRRRAAVGNNSAAHGLVRVSIIRVIATSHGHGSVIVAFRHHSSLGSLPRGIMLGVCGLPHLIGSWLLIIVLGLVVHLWTRHGGKRLRARRVVVQSRAGPPPLVESLRGSPRLRRCAALVEAWRGRSCWARPRPRAMAMARNRTPGLLHVLSLRVGHVLGAGDRAVALVVVVVHVGIGWPLSRGHGLASVVIAGCRSWRWLTVLHSR